MEGPGLRQIRSRIGGNCGDQAQALIKPSRVPRNPGYAPAPSDVSPADNDERQQSSTELCAIPRRFAFWGLDLTFMSFAPDQEDYAEADKAPQDHHSCHSENWSSSVGDQPGPGPPKTEIQLRSRIDPLVQSSG